MNVQILYRFPVAALQRRLPRSWLLQEGNGGLLALACYGNLVSTAPFTGTLSWHLLEIETRLLLKEAKSPHLLTDLDALYLAYNAPTATWILGSLEFHYDTFSYNILIRTIHEDETNAGLLFEPIFDDPANDMAPIGPFLSLTAYNQRCMFLYLKSAIDGITTPDICLERIELFTGKAVHSTVGYGESALICQQEHAWLLLTLIPQRSVEAQCEDGVVRVVKNYWSFALNGYREDFDIVHWRLDLEESLPGRRAVLGRFNDFEWLGINAAAIPGPLVPQTKQPTFVVGMTMMDIFDREGFDHTSEEASWITNKIEALLCIDTDGKLVQKCTDTIGLRLQLCQIGALTVGVDLLQGRWRLWNWAPLSETSFQKLVWLDQHIQRAHVVAGKGKEEHDASYFWLIEESSVGVRVSKYDASTLMTIGSDVTVTDMHLLEPQNGSGSLDWHTSIDAMNYQDTLLLLGIDMHNQLVLYQVR